MMIRAVSQPTRKWAHSSATAFCGRCLFPIPSWRRSRKSAAASFVLLLMSAANVFNLGADIGAMGSSVALLIPGRDTLFTIMIAVFSLVTILFIPLHDLRQYLKWLTLSLFAYAGVAFLVRISWREVAHATLIPHITVSRESFVALIAVLGTTISPYLFFLAGFTGSGRSEKPSRRKSPKARAVPSSRGTGTNSR